MFNSVKKALGYRDVYYNVKNKKYWTDAVGDQYAPLPVVSGDDSNVNLVSQSGRSANIFIDNASIAVVDSELINTIPDAECYLLCKTPITDDDLIGEIASNPGENYYLYTYDGLYDDNFPYGQELIAKLTKEEAAICSLSPYFQPIVTGSILEQATRNYPFLMADRRELDKLRAAVAGYYLGQQYDNATVLTKQAYWQDALNAAVSGSIVSTWKVLNDMATAATQGVNIISDYLNDGYPYGTYNPGGGEPAQYPVVTRFNYWSNSVLSGNFGSYMQVGRLNGSTKGISAGYTHYVVFNLALNWASLTSTYTKVTFDGPSGSYSFRFEDAQKQPGDLHYWIAMDTSPDIADEDAARAFTEELINGTTSYYDNAWTITFQNDVGAPGEDEMVLELVMQNMAGHIIKYPRYGVANPPTPQGVAPSSFKF